MHNTVDTIGTLLGIIGALICAASGAQRLIGSFTLGQFETSTLFILGTAVMVLACFLKLHAMAQRLRE